MVCVVSGLHAEIAQEVAPAAAALAVLPPGFAAEEQLQVLRALLNLALGLQDDFAACAAAVAAASVVNKAPKGADLSRMLLSKLFKLTIGTDQQVSQFDQSTQKE